MFGVVLWSNAEKRQAVFWCEDHGDLAFFKTDAVFPWATLDAGDLVQFDLAMEGKRRIAENPTRVGEGLYCELLDWLSAVARNEQRTPEQIGEGRVATCTRFPAPELAGEAPQMVLRFPQ